LPMQILKFFPDLQLDVVEQDAQLQAIAKHFFGVKPSNNLKIIIADGREYLRNTPKTYDLILIDAFVRSVIPPALSTKGFVELTTIHLNKNGALATNIISAYHGLGDTVLKQQFATYKSIFKHVDIYPADKVLSFWISQNFILIASNKARALKPGLRFEKLKPPPVTSSDVLVD